MSTECQRAAVVVVVNALSEFNPCRLVSVSVSMCSACFGPTQVGLQSGTDLSHLQQLAPEMLILLKNSNTYTQRVIKIIKRVLSGKLMQDKWVS